MNDDGFDYDLVVVGGGPAGSTVATLVAMQGHRVLLLEKETFPRYQIGESLLPATIHGICRLTGVADEIARAGFPLKRGGTFRWGRNPEPWTFAFGISPKFASDGATAYQVERMKFDQILLDNARRKGVTVRERCAVVDVLEDGERVCGVRFDDEDGVRRELRSRYVVDASGHRSRIQNRVGGERHYPEFFRNLALFGYFEGGKRLPEPNSGNILAVAFSGGWFWYIPLSDSLTSVGAVLRPEALDRVREGDRETVLRQLISECPMIAEYLAEATRVTSGPYGEVRIRKDYSYIRDTFTRPGMFLVGDAACFIDPVFSSGVHLATFSALLASRSINSRLAGELDEASVLAEFEARYRREYGLFHDFLVAFYDMQQDEDSYFWTAKRVSDDRVASDMQAFVQLVGGAGSDERAFVDADYYLRERKAAFQELADVVQGPVAEAGEDRNLLGASMLKEVLKEGVHVQTQAALGGNVDEQRPIRPGGLIPSDDGMRWRQSEPVTPANGPAPQGPSA
ncbi:FAD-dependent oxidoreductase [Micromonospora sp. 15K316]|uniref:tryptophan 7-halogenase n=1 Tax=Micromonospora sp. 15K316 TaxID=2530376 RepID=UPI0010451600|nr:tryptophan 7-halogenase [Micromonospora sp. 15K316]TDC40387.1 FAD-dependent oxidoreductase [Micromonospora sp. 15K316]